MMSGRRPYFCIGTPDRALPSAAKATVMDTTISTSPDERPRSFLMKTSAPDTT